MKLQVAIIIILSINLIYLLLPEQQVDEDEAEVEDIQDNNEDYHDYANSPLTILLLSNRCYSKKLSANRQAYSILYCF